MSCPEYKMLIHGYLDGELDLVNTLKVEEHMRDCTNCAHDYRNHETLSAAIGAGSVYFRPSNDLSSRIRARLQQSDRANARRSAFTMEYLRALRFPAWLTLASAAAAAALCVVLIFRLWIITSEPSQELLAQDVLASHVRSLMANHLTDILSSDQHTVKPWFDGKLDFSPPVQDLSNHGFPLVGGRLDYLEDRPVAALVYQRRKHFINLFVWPVAQGSKQSEKEIVMRQGYNIIHWRQAGMTLWAVSDLNNAELQEFVHLVQSN